MKIVLLVMLTFIAYGADYSVAIFEQEAAILALKENYEKDKEVTVWYDKIKVFKKNKIDALEVFYKENPQGNKYEIEGKYDEMILNCYNEIDGYIGKKINRFIVDNYKSKFAIIIERRGLMIYHQEIPLIDITGLIITGLKNGVEKQ